MKLSQKTIALSVLGVALTLSIVIITLGIYKTPSKSPALRETENKPLANAVEVLGDSSLPASGTLKNKENSFSEKENLTEAVAEKIAEGIIQKNPGGPSLFEGESVVSATNPEAIMNDALNDAVKNFDYAKIKPVIPNTSLNIVSSVDPKKLQEYFTNFQNTLRTANASVSPKLESPSLDGFRDIVETFTIALNKLYKLEVPGAITPLHKEQIALMEAQKNVFSAFADAEDDPFAALVALQALPLIETDFKKLGNQFSQFISTHNITL